MALQIWLPLDGDLRNQGLDGSQPQSVGTTINNSGKIGKCFEFDGSDDRIYFTNLNLSNYEMTGACWVKLLSYKTYGFLFSLGDTTAVNAQMSIYINHNSHKVAINCNGSELTSSYILPLNEWHHICFTYKNTESKLYVDGELKYTGTNAGNYKTSSNLTIGARSNSAAGGGSSFYYPGNELINDFRIYDHCLSIKEVKELAKGLILHYKLSKPMPNLLQNGAFTSLTTGNTGLGTGIYATSWGGYNSGISNPTTNYHACIDNTTFNYPVYMYNETNGSRNWKGISQSISKSYIEGSTEYMFSCDVYQTLSGGKIWGGFYYKKTGASSANFASGSFNISASMIPTNKWTTISIKVPFNNDIDSSATTVSFYIYGYGFSDNGIVYIKNVKLEKGNKATVWIPNEVDALYAAAGYASGIVYDCSGYQNNGIEVGTITGSADTPRYRTSYYFDGIDSAIQVPYNATVFQTNFTINLWFKKTELGSKGYETLFGGPSGFEMDTRNGNSTTLSLYMTGTRGGNAFSSFSFGEWYMVTMINDGTNELYYINGELKKTIEKKSMPTGNYFIGAWSTSSKQNFKGYISDFRIYCTALSAADVKALYTDAGYVDKNGNFHAYEFVEE